ncbi:MAG: Unknown protein [uncultured Sulfurovum sp.]|uniref:Uncharacterized protein n=1 Tax=uncultured Sulfurovum sp. TaxID=269237 RepID=A0A6S6TEB2_9BACT|nr:MAG: Unknown protein [uncultured Sulfurovum sp.]
MKKIFKYLLVTIMVLNTAVVAKETTNDLAGLEKTFKLYKQHNLEGNLEKTIDYLYPAIFELTPKKSLVESFKMIKEMGKMPKVNAINEKIRTPLKTYKQGSYTVIAYTTDMTMNIMPPVKKENKEEYEKVQKMLNNPEELESYKSFMIQMLKTQMGKDAEISTKKESMIIEISKASKIIAINENKSGWKFIEPEPLMLEHLKKLLPQEIVSNEKEIFEVEVVSAEAQMAAMMEMMKANK